MSITVPDAWMPNADMRRIHIHWTAGGYTPNATDKKSYHILIDGNGKLSRGNHPITANVPPLGNSSTYAPHTARANSHAIGVSMCCMRGSSERPFKPGPDPLNENQWNAMIQAVAQLSKRYGINVTPMTILTHAEVQSNLGIPQSGKWDIVVLPFDSRTTGARAVGDKLRREVAAARDVSSPAPTKPPDTMKAPRFRVTGVKPSSLNFRNAPNGDVVGALPEGTRVEQLGISGGWWQVRTPAGHIGWVWHSFLTATN